MKKFILGTTLFLMAIVAVSVLWQKKGPLINMSSIKNLIPSLNGGNSSGFIPNEMLDTSAQIDALSGLSSEPPILTKEDYGELSPQYGKVLIEKNKAGPKESELDMETITIYVPITATESILLKGWSLASIISNKRAFLGDAVILPYPDKSAKNEISPIQLKPGQRVIVSTGFSPIGFSFRTNSCTGFFKNYGQFEPELDEECVSVSNSMPATIKNLQEYGTSCIEFAKTIPRCSYITKRTDGAQMQKQKCLDALVPSATYSACVIALQKEIAFSENREWRVFLNQKSEMWRENYEAVALLDENGKVVDVFAY